METDHTECKHSKVKWGGFWDGKTKTGERTGGPVVNCKICGKELHMTWPDWYALPKEDREGWEKINGMNNQFKK